MTEPEPSSGPPSSPSGSPSTRTVRTFKEWSDAEAAVEMLAKQNIPATLLDLATSATSTKTTPNAVRLVVDAELAGQAEALLKGYHRSKVQNVGRIDADLQKRERQRKIYGRDRKTKGYDPKSGLFVSLALLGAFGAVAYMVSSFFRDRKQEEAAAIIRKPRFSNLDVNSDRKIDHKRYLDTRGAPIREEIDFNFDGIFDTVAYYEEGRMIEKRRDLDGNGQWDEFFYFDYLGRPYYSQVIMNGKGGVSTRTYYLEEQEFADYVWPEEVEGNPAAIPYGGDSWPFRILTASKSNGIFDKLEERNLAGKVTVTRDLAPDAPESGTPTFPKPPQR